MSTLTTPYQIESFRLAALRSALLMEKAGMKGKGKSALSQVRAMMGDKKATHDECRLYLRETLDARYADSQK